MTSTTWGWSLTVAVVGTMAGLAGGAQAPASGAPFSPPATEAAEIALALSALPEPMRPAAAVYVLGPSGYLKKKEGSSGVTCLVERSRPDTQEPICWDREGVETIMPLVMAKAEWRAAGVTVEEIERRTAEGFAKGKFRAPRRPGIAYMVSTENYVFNGQKVVKYHPHVMSYAPYLTNADIGSNGRDPYAPWILNEGSPHAYLIVVTRHGG